MRCSHPATWRPGAAGWAWCAGGGGGGGGPPPIVEDDELESARALRLVLHRAFSAIAQGRRPRRADLEALARDHASAAGAARLAPADHGAWRLTWPAAEP